MNPQDERLLSEHLPYEIDMARETYRASLADQPDQIIRNALVESWAIHARNLVEFFAGSHQAARVSTFVRSQYQPLNNPAVESLQSRISDQITHLTLDQPARPGKEIRPDFEVMRLLEAEITRFLSNVAPEDRAMIERNCLSKPIDLTVPTPGPPPPRGRR
jgi:hypothetical protein